MSYCDVTNWGGSQLLSIVNKVKEKMHQAEKVPFILTSNDDWSWCFLECTRSLCSSFKWAWKRTVCVYYRFFLFGPTSTLLEAFPRKHVLLPASLDFASLSALPDRRLRPPCCQCCSAGERLYVLLFSLWADGLQISCFSPPAYRS